MWNESWISNFQTSRKFAKFKHIIMLLRCGLLHSTIRIQRCKWSIVDNSNISYYYYHSWHSSRLLLSNLWFLALRMFMILWICSNSYCLCFHEQNFIVTNSLQRILNKCGEFLFCVGYAYVLDFYLKLIKSHVLVPNNMYVKRSQ